MRIDSQNIDKWLFDYFEGNLSAEQVKDLELYCLLNPEADVERMAWEQAYLKEGVVPVYANKEALIQESFWTRDKLVVATLLLLLLSSGIVFFILSGTGLKIKYTPQLSNEISTSHSSHVKYDYKTEMFSQSKSKESNTQYSTKTNGVVANNTLLNQTVSNISSNSVHNKLNQKNDILEKSKILESKSQTSINIEDAAISTLIKGTSIKEVDSHIALNQELNKFDENSESVAKISTNPDYEGIDLDLKKSLHEINLNKRSAGYEFRRFFIRLFRYDVGLTNLRDQNIIMPEFQVMNFNSSFAGSTWGGRYDANYRARWLGSNQFMHSATFSYDTYVKGMGGGIGFVANFDDFGNGKYRDYNISVIYSPKMQVGKNIFIEPSLKLTLGANTANFNKSSEINSIEWQRGLVFSNVSNQNIGNGKVGFYQDIGAGLVVNTQWFYAGVMFDNLAEHRIDVLSDANHTNKMPIHFTAVIATDYQSDNNEKFIVSPFVAYEKFGKINELWAGSNLRWNGLIAGASISTDFNFRGSLGFQAKSFKMVYSYDQTKTFIENKSVGSHSLSMRLNLSKYTKHSRNRRY